MKSESADHSLPLHICARTQNRERFPIPLEEVWAIFEDYLFFIRMAFGIEIYAFVLMPNHFHMIAKAPNGNLSQAMGYFMRQTSRMINSKSKKINHLWGRRYYRSTLDSYNYFMITYKYVYRNPVKAGLCKNVEDYPFSTLRGLMGLTKLHIPMREDTVIFDSGFNEEVLYWLNRSALEESDSQVKKALTKRAFKLPRQVNGHCNSLDQDSKSFWNF